MTVDNTLSGDVDAGAAAPADDTTADQERVSVTITDNGDGSYSVSDGDQDADDQTADSIEAALTIAGEMLHGQEPAEDADSGDMTDDDAPMAPADAKTYWNQLAKKKASARAEP